MNLGQFKLLELDMRLLLLAAALNKTPQYNVAHELTMTVAGPNNMSNRGYAGYRSANIGTGNDIGAVSNNKFFGNILIAIVNRWEGNEIRVEVDRQTAGETIPDIKAIIVGTARYDLYNRGGNQYSNSYGLYFRGEAGKFPPNGPNVPVKFVL